MWLIESKDSQMYINFVINFVWSQSYRVSTILILILWMKRLKLEVLSNLEY